MTIRRVMHARTNLEGRDPERGSLTVWVAMLMAAILLCIGIAVDFNGQVHKLEEVRSVAAQAARAGGQEIAAPQAIRGDGVTVDPYAARAAAKAYLDAAGVQGTVEVRGGTRLVVTVNGKYKTVFLSMIGASSLSVSGTAEARLTRVMGGVER
ncbi:pilus assembly protein TadG-related protein [Promicromonospora sp. Marseille-Q5078]